MYTFACKDVGVNCNFVASGATVEEVKQMAFTHAGIVHADLMKNMSDAEKAQLSSAVEKSIKSG